MDRRRLLLIGLAVCAALVVAGLGLSSADRIARDHADGLNPIRQRTQQVARIMKKDSPGRMSRRTFSDRLWTLIRDTEKLPAEKPRNSEVYEYRLTDVRPGGYKVHYWFYSASPGFSDSEAAGGLDRTLLCGEKLTVAWAAIYDTDADPDPGVQAAWRSYRMAELTGETATFESNPAARSAAENSLSKATRFRLDGSRQVNLPCKSPQPLAAERPIQILRARTSQIRQMMATDRNPNRLSEAAYSDLFWRLFGSSTRVRKVQDVEGLYRYELFHQDANGLQVRIFFHAATPDFVRLPYQGGINSALLCGQTIPTEWRLNYNAMNDTAPQVMAAWPVFQDQSMSSNSDSYELAMAASAQHERDTEAQLTGTRTFTVQCPDRRR